MKLQMYNYQCNKCKNKFKAPELIGDPYGEFLLRSPAGEMRYLPAMNSEVYLNAGDMVDEYLKDTRLSSVGKAKVLHQIFSLACDLAADSSEFKIGGDPICPACQGNNMYSWEPTHPAEIIEVEVPLVTHNHWSKLTDLDKQQKIQEAVDRVLANKESLGIV